MVLRRLLVLTLKSVVVVLVIKLGLYLRKRSRSSLTVTPLETLPGLGKVLNPDQTVNILNKRSVVFPLSPPACTSSDWMLVMVSSRPANTRLREHWRKRGRSSRVRVVFLVADTVRERDQEELEREAEEHGDIVQVKVRDGHRLLAYKILAGHVWSYLHCPGVRHVAKSDDNVEVDMARLVESLQSRGENSAHWEQVISCPSVSHQPKVIRSSSGGMSGNWSESTEVSVCCLSQVI